MVSKMTTNNAVPSDGPVWTIVLAAGAGRRYGTSPKQYELLGADRVIDRSLAVSRAIGKYSTAPAADFVTVGVM